MLQEAPREPANTIAKPDQRAITSSDATRNTEVQACLEALAKRCKEHGIDLNSGGIAFGGSISYGLDTPESDVDLRGFALPPAHDILMMHDFGTLDTTSGADYALHSLNKTCDLLLACNPNTIELLGVLPEHIIVDSDAYSTLRTHADWFVSRKCAATFGGYAAHQLRRIENALNREDEDKVADNALRSIRSSLESLADQHPSLAQSSFTVHEREGRIVVSGELHGASFSDLKAFAGECNDTALNAASLAARNIKRTSSKLAKHASHLIRMLQMGSRMLETGQITTWCGDDRELLLNLKKGMWLHESPDGTRAYDDAFWDLLREEQARFERAKRETSLPAAPDEGAVREFVHDIHQRIVLEAAANSD